MNYRFITAFAVGLLLVSGVHEPVAQEGPVWYVATDGDDVAGDGSPAAPFATIQRAVDAASPGHEVALADGEYTGPGNRDIQLGGKGLAFFSQSGDTTATACVIDCGGFDGFVFNAVEPGETAGLSFGFLTIRNAATAISVNLDIEDFYALTQVTAMRLRVTGCARGIDAHIWNTRLNVQHATFADNYGSGIDFGFGHRLEKQESGTTSGGVWVTDSEFRNNGVGFYGLIYFGVLSATIERCVFAGNDTGFDGVLDGTDLTFQDCRFDSNAVGLNIWGVLHQNLTLDACQAKGNSSNGIAIQNDSSMPVTIRDSVVRDNGGHGIWWQGWDGDLTLEDVEIVANQGWGVGTSFKSAARDPGAKRSTAAGFVRCRVDSNLAGGVHHSSGQHLVQDCVITDNVGDGLRLDRSPWSWEPQYSATITGTTIAGNTGIGVASDQDTIVLERVLIAGNGGASVDLPATATIAIACSDIHGNAGGDWVEPVLGLLGQDGNVASDPLFCDPDAGDHGLLDISPCQPGHHPDGADCGRIGALGAGCFAAPRFLSLADVPDDQGGQIRLAWAASHLDQPGVEEPVIAYGVYRRQDALQSSGGGAGAEDAPLRDEGKRLLGWDYLTTVPGRGDAGYQVVAPTLCDSTDAWDPQDPATWCWSVFMVSAMTASSFVYHDSAPDSGYSADNLAPAQPLGLAVSYDYQSGHELAWLPNTEPDLREYRIYRGTTPDFPALPGTHIARTTAAAWSDTAVAADLHYQVTAVDRAGNVSAAASPYTVASAPDAGGLAPVRTALVGVHPNPFNPATTISFELARRSPVAVRIYDLAGRLVREIMAGEVHDAGRHAVVWQGRDRGGRVAASGRYLCRFEADGVRETRSLLLLK